MGSKEDGGVAHAVVGDRWLDTHLEKVGKTKQALAKFLYENRLAAVAEVNIFNIYNERIVCILIYQHSIRFQLCDDEFEEHVLPYNIPNRRGLHLHGMNFNTVDLKTWPSGMVAKFAKEWGFIPIHYYIKQTVEEARNFTNDIKQNGSLDGMPIEGFVVRTKKTTPSGQDFFFKVKYDEPYLMYREWREVTKALLSKRKPRV